MDTLSRFELTFNIISVVVAGLSVLAGAVAAIKWGAVRSIKFGSLKIEGGITPEQVSALETTKKDEPFEATALSNYYNHALSRANISFWFSLIFGSIGFGVIVLAIAVHNENDLWGTVVKVVSGTVIDAVSSLFFVQSTNAQKSMSDFFEKLRMDRMHAEAREMINEVEDRERRDQLKSQLILKYAGIDRLLSGTVPAGLSAGSGPAPVG